MGGSGINESILGLPTFHLSEIGAKLEVFHVCLEPVVEMSIIVVETGVVVL